MTIHINAKKDEIAKFVLMPGDPIRAKVMAEKFLTNPRLVNTIRGMSMYTGLYKDMPVTIAASGMGNGSMGIYSHELFTDYDVDIIIRVGTAGSYRRDLPLYSIFLAAESYGESDFAKIVTGKRTRIVPATPSLIKGIEKTAKALNIKLEVGRTHSADVFYRQGDKKAFAKRNKLDVVEMEAFGLYSNAQALGKKSASLFTISDNLITGESTGADARQHKMDEMFKLALETGLRFYH